MPRDHHELVRRGALGACACVVLFLAGCGGGSHSEELNGVDTGVRDQDRFLEYFDPQAGLAGGGYTVTAADAGSTGGSYRLSIDQSNGAMTIHTGQWSAGGSDSYTFRMPQWGGAKLRLESAARGSLALAHTRSSGSDVASSTAGSAGADVSIDLPASGINSAQYARAYYKAVDPNDQRTTLADWKTASGYAACDPANLVIVRFRDTKDLGYGRHMHVCLDTDPLQAGPQLAAYVDNYQVDPIPQLAYSDLNLQALLDLDRRWLLGTNAIEFTPPDSTLCASGDTPDAPCSTPVAKFFTFAPEDDRGRQVRVLKANLDGRGDKYMPGICVQCHGGRLLPLDPGGELPRLRTSDDLGLPGDVEAKLQAFEVDTFDFADSGPFSRANQEEKLRRLNATVYDSYDAGDYANGVGTDSGKWDPAFEQDLIKGWYGGDVHASGSSFNGDYVPPGWQPNTTTGTPPPGAGKLFTEVVGPRCIVCHGKRGTTLHPDIQFSTYQQFISHDDDNQLERLIFDEALMPAALLQFKHFWGAEGQATEAAQLGSFLKDFSHGNSDGTVEKPGRPIANAGPDRTVGGLPMTLSAEDSVFAQSYAWSIVSAPTGAGASLARAGTARAELQGAADGTYEVRLTVAGSDGSTDSDTATITVQSSGLQTAGGLTIPAPRDLSSSDIASVFVSATCTSCHYSGSTHTGIPLHYTSGTDYTGGPDLYHRVLARVNFRDPQASLILRKPSGHHHYGALLPGFDIDGTTMGSYDHKTYDMFYTWIIEGAPE